MAAPKWDVTGNLMPPEALPEYMAHTPGKHGLLRGYLNAWIPIIGSRFGKMAVIDGFASAGRYRTNEKGSPLLMLDAWRGRADRGRLRGQPTYFFIEKNRKFAEHLRAEIDALGASRGEQVHLARGSYEDGFPEVVTRIRAMGSPPTFAFVDPYGYKGNPFEHVLLLREHVARAEALVYVPVTHMARFVDTEITSSALNKAFGGDGWKDARDHETREAKVRELARIFETQMRGAFEWVTAFRIEPKNRNDYYLFFGSNSMKGLQVMKTAMWDLDPTGGQAYAPQPPPPPAMEVAQESLTGWTEPVDDTPQEDFLAADLLSLLRGEFTGRTFSIEEAAVFTLCRTRYLDTRHLKNRTLRPAELADHVIVDRPGSSGYPAGTTLRFPT